MSTVTMEVAQAQLPEGAPAPPAKVASLPHRISEREGALTLWRQPIQRISSLGLLNYFQKYPSKNSFPNTAFFLVTSIEQATDQGRIVWAAYIYNDRAIRPIETWMADLANPVSSNNTQVVLARSISDHVEIRAYEVQLDKNLGAFPVKLDPAGYESWPAGSEPAAIHTTRLLGRDISGVAQIKAIAEGNTVIVHCKRDLAGTPPVHFRFDRTVKKWTQVAADANGEPIKDQR